MQYNFLLEEGYDPLMWLKMRDTLFSNDTDINKNVNIHKNSRLYGYALQQTTGFRKYLALIIFFGLIDKDM